jgi:hypothetical protein
MIRGNRRCPLLEVEGVGRERPELGGDHDAVDAHPHEEREPDAHARPCDEREDQHVRGEEERHDTQQVGAVEPPPHDAVGRHEHHQDQRDDGDGVGAHLGGELRQKERLAQRLDDVVREEEEKGIRSEEEQAASLAGRMRVNSVIMRSAGVRRLSSVSTRSPHPAGVVGAASCRDVELVFVHPMRARVARGAIDIRRCKRVRSLALHTPPQRSLVVVLRSNRGDDVLRWPVRVKRAGVRRASKSAGGAWKHAPEIVHEQM